MKCKNCGTELEKDAQICNTCGTKVNEAQKESLFSKEGLFSISGRRNRLPYLEMVFIGVICLKIANGAFSINSFTRIGGLLFWILATVLLCTNTAKRLQDLNFNGLYAVIFIVVMNLCMLFDQTRRIGAILSIVFTIINLFLLFKKGTDGPNKYGPDPLKQD